MHTVGTAIVFINIGATAIEENEYFQPELARTCQGHVDALKHALPQQMIGDDEPLNEIAEKRLQALSKCLNVKLPAEPEQLG